MTARHAPSGADKGAELAAHARERAGHMHAALPRPEYYDGSVPPAPFSLDSRRRCVDLLPSDVPATRDVFPLVGGFPFVSSAVTSTS